MRAIEILRREHGWIRWMSECLEMVISEGRAEEQLPPEAYELMHLYESFADGRHQEKEETLLFGELIATASDSDRRVLGKLLEDHEGERRLMASMRLNLLGAVQGEPLCVREFARAAGHYMDLHRAHMHREASVLFPMAERLLTPESDARVAAGFEEMEGGPGDPRGLEEQILRLRRRIGLPIPPAA
jgi:hemerythrin-like domain-containing protein